MPTRAVGAAIGGSDMPRSLSRALTCTSTPFTRAATTASPGATMAKPASATTANTLPVVKAKPMAAIAAAPCSARAVSPVPSVAVAALQDALRTSTLLKGVASARRDALRDSRALTSAEIAALESNGNSSMCDDWHNVRVLDGTLSVKCIKGCSFNGDVVLGGTYTSAIEMEDGVVSRAGLYNTVLSSCFIDSNTLVMGTKLVARTFVRSGAAIIGCGVVSVRGKTASFGNGVAVPLGLDGDGRATRCYAEVTVKAAAEVACHRSAADEALQAKYAELMEEYVTAASAPFNVIEAGARLSCCPRLSNVYIGQGAVIECCQMSNVSVLSSSEERTVVEGGAHVSDSMLQWGAHVDQLAIVEGSVMCEHSHADKHGKLLGSLLGPNSGVSEGEISASLVGPFVGFHHQALLIAAMWPAGKGNVGYGANVGSNHTGKAPDQELRPGEGVFFGLGTCIKFPSNFEESPYSIIATGSTTLPQRLRFPFSLVNLPGENIEGISPAFNELSAAWVLSDSVFTVWRNELKFAKRDKARRQRTPSRIFTPHNVDLMMDACQRLKDAKPATHFTAKREPVFTSREIVGLGKNYLRDSNRTKAIKTYTFYARLAILQALFDALRTGIAPLDGASAAAGSGAGAGAGVASAAATSAATAGLDLEDVRARWSHAKPLLKQEFGAMSTKELLRQFGTMFAASAAACERSKAKDAKRGARVIDDYASVHPPAHASSVVKSVHTRSSMVHAGVNDLIAKL